MRNEVLYQERTDKGEKKHALSFEYLRGWFQSICLSRCFRLPSLQLVRACTRHDAWRLSVYYGTSPLKTQGKRLNSNDYLHLYNSIAQIFALGSSRCLFSSDISLPRNPATQRSVIKTLYSRVKNFASSRSTAIPATVPLEQSTGVPARAKRREVIIFPPHSRLF